MSVVDSTNFSDPNANDSAKRLSYKFQRLRERIRDAIQTGELAGKLPGERVLARRFKVNAKTLSKALTELAAEGVLHRNVGLGTFVKGSEPASQNQQILFLADPDQTHCPVIQKMSGDDAFQVSIQTDMSQVSHNLLAGYRWTIITSKLLSEELIRDLSIRGHNIILFGRDISLYSVHYLHYDIAGGVIEMARKLRHEGHRKILLVDSVASDELHTHVKRSIRSDIDIELCHQSDLLTKMKHGVTAVICRSQLVGDETAAALKGAGYSIPQDVSVTAVGVNCRDISVTGHYIDPNETIEAIEHLLEHENKSSPARVWISGKFHDAHTTQAVH